MFASQFCVDLVKVTITTKFTIALAVHAQKSKFDSLLSHPPGLIFFLFHLPRYTIGLEEGAIDEIW